MLRDNQPLTKEERAVVCRTLIKAYLRYRDMPIRSVCRDLRIFVFKQHKDDLTGYTGSLHDPGDELIESYRKGKRKKLLREALKERRRAERYDRWIEIPGKSPPAVKEHTFWHEVGHILVCNLGVFPRYVGYHASLYRLSQRHWSEERAVEAFGTAMTLYRFGIDPELETIGENFIFADQTSDWYGQMFRHGARVVGEACCKAEEERRNSVDMPALQTLVAVLEKYGASTTGLQRDLPMDYKDVHREPSELMYHFVSWLEDERRNDVHRHKPSWEHISPKKQRLYAQAKALREAFACVRYQLVLLPERAEIDKASLEKCRKRLERAVKKFQRS